MNKDVASRRATNLSNRVHSRLQLALSRNGAVAFLDSSVRGASVYPTMLRLASM